MSGFLNRSSSRDPSSEMLLRFANGQLATTNF